MNISDSAIQQQFLDDIKQMNINSIPELMLYLPVKYKDYRKPLTRISEALGFDEKVYIKLKLISKPIISFEPRKPPSIKMQYTDSIHTASAMVFGNVSDWETLNSGDIVYLTGKFVNNDYNGKIYTNIKSAEIVKPHEQGMIVPVYKGQVGDNRKKGAPKSNKKNITSNEIAKNILLGLNENMDGATNLICTRAGVGEAKILADLGYPFDSMEQLLAAMHRPRSAEELTKAIKTTRLINGYKTMQDALASRSIMPVPESSINISLKTTKQIVDSLPFTLTSDQKHAVWDCIQDISSNVPMNRLISGDVGCGKTLTYGLPLILSHLASKNKTGVSLVLTPNSLLAMQIEKELREIAPQFNVRTKLIVAGDKNVSKIDQNTILVGTTALIHYMKKHGKHLSVDMLVIDEQQKLGSEQRNKLIQRHTNVLQATATAIPRTTAQIMFGAMDISIIEQCPVKKTIDTLVTGTESKKDIMTILNNTMADSHQIAILYPTRTKLDCEAEIHIPCDKINEISDLLNSHKIKTTSTSSALGYNLKCNKQLDTSEGYVATVKFKESKRDEFFTVMDEAEKLGCRYIGETNGDIHDVEQAFERWNKLYPGKVVMIHGGMKPNDKTNAIERAKKGFDECKVIITSSVIEIGLTMPDLRTLLVIGAEKYGAGTLHQFRGRLARKGGHGTFIMMSSKNINETNEDTVHRLNILKNNTRGSKIAEEDMIQRGFGSLNNKSTAQSGNLDGVFRGVKVLPSDITELLNTTTGSQLLKPRRDAKQ